MHKLILTTLLNLLIGLYSYSQDTVRLKEQLQSMIHAVANKDYQSVIKYTHPSLVKAIGGPDIMLERLHSSIKELAEQGIKIDTTIIGELGEFKSFPNNIYTFIPEFTIMTIPNPSQKMIGVSTLLAISDDNGKNWTFIDAGLAKEKIEMLLGAKFDIPPPLIDKPIVTETDQIPFYIEKLLEMSK